MKPIRTIFIANRAEIALRIQATCRMLGIKTVVAYTPHDANCVYVTQADEAYLLKNEGAQAYLSQQELLNYALQAGADAIHPGYGFLSENASFAERVATANMSWIGPSVHVLRTAGDKARMRSFAMQHDIPVIPGIEVSLSQQNCLERAQDAALHVSYPVVLKNPLSGGGKAMRRVSCAEEFTNAWHAVIRESGGLHAITHLLIEKYITDARHIEIQIAGDGQNFIHLYERDCTLQRHHQKIIEEGPASNLPMETRHQLRSASLKLAQALHYTTIGTVEFLVTPDQKWYFLEINPRLQVEHSVTEAITGVDLVALQINLASGQPLTYQQNEIMLHGHALECRIYAEDSFNNFLPSAGPLHALHMSRNPATRVDHDLTMVSGVSPLFDPMIAKITTHGNNRESARQRMCAALEQTIIGGPKTNIPFLQALLSSSAFINQKYHTRSLHDDAFIASLANPDSAEFDDAAACVHALMHMLNLNQLSQKVEQASAPRSAWKAKTWS